MSKCSGKSQISFHCSFRGQNFRTNLKPIKAELRVLSRANIDWKAYFPNSPRYVEQKRLSSNRARSFLAGHAAANVWFILKLEQILLFKSRAHKQTRRMCVDIFLSHMEIVYFVQYMYLEKEV